MATEVQHTASLSAMQVLAEIRTVADIAGELATF